MSKAQFVYVTYISSTPEKVWNALIQPEFTRLYWDHDNVSDWKKGSSWEHRSIERNEVDIAGKVVESDPPRRLVLTWADPDDLEKPEEISRVTMELVEHMPGVVKLTVVHEDLEAEMLKGISRGWPMVLSNLKSLLETGAPINLW
jgi:uncharacterized protein YndB with AHSA1/START domain